MNSEENDPFDDWPEPDDDLEAPPHDRSLLGVIGQLTAAVLTVGAVVALLMVAAAALRWLFP